MAIGAWFNVYLSIGLEVFESRTAPKEVEGNLGGGFMFNICLKTACPRNISRVLYLHLTLP